MTNNIKCYRDTDGELKLDYNTTGERYITATTKREADALAAVIGASPAWIVQAGTGDTLWIARVSRRGDVKPT